jgi:hypothetical protein
MYIKYGFRHGKSGYIKFYSVTYDMYLEQAKTLKRDQIVALMKQYREKIMARNQCNIL